MAPLKIEPCYCGGQVEFWLEQYTEAVYREHAACDSCKFQWAEHCDGPTLKQAQRVANAEQRVARVKAAWWQYLGWGTSTEVAHARRKLVNAKQALARAEKAAKRRSKATPL